MEKTIEHLQSKFPKMWFKDGSDFSSMHIDTVWTGEGSYIGDESAFDYYSYGNTLGIHPAFQRELDKLGLFAEFYDAGTVFLYKV